MFGMDDTIHEPSKTLHPSILALIQAEDPKKTNVGIQMCDEMNRQEIIVSECFVNNKIHSQQRESGKDPSGAKFI